jgi:uncharacterized OsmC-like protein
MTSLQDVTAAVERVESVLRRRPEAGLHDDAPATASWQGATRVVVAHDNGMRMLTDMPAELGGGGDQVTPGWLFRAGLAACATTSIALAAARRGIAPSALEVRVRSRSDTRGLLGLCDEHGGPVGAGPSELRMEVRIAASGVAAERLRALVEEGCRCSPIPNAVQQATPLALQIVVDVD